MNLAAVFGCLWNFALVGLNGRHRRPRLVCRLRSARATSLYNALNIISVHRNCMGIYSSANKMNARQIAGNDSRLGDKLNTRKPLYALSWRT